MYYKLIKMKKFIITAICIFSFVFNAYAGSDGELALKKNEAIEITKVLAKARKNTTIK